MSYLAAMLVRSSATAEVADAVRAAFLAIGAVERSGPERFEVRIGEPHHSWVLVTDSTLHTIDMGVAAKVAAALDTRVAAFGSRGSTYGKATLKIFGAWHKKLPGSPKPNALRTIVDRLAPGIWPLPYEVESRPGVTLTFDVSRARRTIGPFKSNTTAELLDARANHQREVSSLIVGPALNNLYDTPFEALRGLLDLGGWQRAFDDVMHTLQSRSMDLTVDSARLMVALAARALEPLVASSRDEFLGHAVYRPIRFGLPILCALVAGDAAAFDALVAKLDDADAKHRVTIYVYGFSFLRIRALGPELRARLERALPIEPTFEWLLEQPHDRKHRQLDDAAAIAAMRGEPLAERVLARAALEAATDKGLADAIAREAFRFVYAEVFEPALVLFDRIIELPLGDNTAYTNALYAVQADNNKLPFDAARARRYVAACAPHAEDNPAIYINLACVHLELADRAAMFAALDAAKRHRLKTELVALRDQAMFAPLRGDARFDALTKRKPAPKRR